MPCTQCCVPGCLNRGGHRFPGKERRKVRQAWILSIKRADNRVPGRLWKPSQCSVVCGSHFLLEDYISETSYGGTCQVKRLKENACPSVFSWTANTTSNKRRKLCRADPVKSVADTSDSPYDVPAVGEEVDISSCNSRVTASATSISTQTDDLTECGNATAVPQIQSTSFSASRFMDDPKGMHCFTGLESFEKFTFVFNTLGPASNCLSYMYGPISGNISVEDRFFLVLIKLRRYYSNFELSRLFNISESDVYNIFCTWIRFISLQWKEIETLWPSQELVRFFSSNEFKTQFPTTRVIIDGTECPVKKPSFPVAQQSTFSTYKNRNTVKILTGISPGGLCSYLSPAYGGSTSDRQIVERSALTRLCNAGDSIMSDKSFDVQDIFAPIDVIVNIPTFFRKKNRMSNKEVIRDRKISAKRVHVERFIGLAKTFKIVTHPLNSSETILSSDITFVCFMLCNFRNGIIPN